jgi:polyhydroxyalkanoate synthesis regulator phasin
MANEWKHYLDVGITFSDTTRKRAEAFVRDLVRAGEVQQERAQKMVDDVVDRSRKNTEELISLVRSELKAQVSTLGIATKDDIERLEARINRLAKAPASGARKTARKTTAGKSAARKTAAKKTSSAKKG